MEPQKTPNIPLIVGGALALAALASAVWYYGVRPASAPEPSAGEDTVGANISEAAQTPAENIPDTNPFRAETNPFADYPNPFE
jgi:hypothetical protein